MKELVLPVPKMVSATYVVPVSTPMGTAEARQKASTAVETRLTGPLRTLTAEWLAKRGGEDRGRGSRSAAIRVAGQGAVRPPYSVVFLIDLGNPPPAVSCGWCQKATADILQAL